MFGNYCRLPVFLPRKNKLQSNQKSRLFFQTDKFFWTDFLLLSTNFLIDWFRQLTGKHLFYRLFPGNKAIYVTGRLCDLNEKNGAEQTNYIGKYNEKHNEHAKPSVRDWHEKMNKKKFSEAICFRAVSWQATVTSTHSTILERNVTLFFLYLSTFRLPCFLTWVSTLSDPTGHLRSSRLPRVYISRVMFLRTRL